MPSINQIKFYLNILFLYHKFGYVHLTILNNKQNFLLGQNNQVYPLYESVMVNTKIIALLLICHLIIGKIFKLPKAKQQIKNENWNLKRLLNQYQLNNNRFRLIRYHSKKSSSSRKLKNIKI